VKKPIIGKAKLPDEKWIKARLRNNLIAPVRRKVLATHIIGSEAKGTATKTSDIDVVIVIPKVKGKTDLKLTEEYHAKFTDSKQKPQWEGRTVDFQFFYEDSAELRSIILI
jgi:predicted nucleotidyltransferase